MTLEPPSVEQDNAPQGHSTILALYALLGISMVLSVAPNIWAALMSFVLFFVVLIAAYVVRGDAETDSLKHNHATFVIRTLWISAFFSILTTIAATAYMMSGIDYTPFEPCAESLANQGLTWLERAGPMEIYALVEPCSQNFVDTNKTLFINAIIIAGGPILVYMFYRIIKGLARAIRGYRLANPREWF